MARAKKDPPIKLRTYDPGKPEDVMAFNDDKCDHFTGLAFKRCRKGVEYGAVMRAIKFTVTIDDGPPIQRNFAYPCFKCESVLGIGCALRRFPQTKEQLATTAFVREMVAEAVAEKDNEYGTMPCPICKKGNLRYAPTVIACTEPGCFNWNA